MANENEDLESLLKTGIEAAKGGNRPEARRLLERALELDDSNQAAWMWLATVVDKPSEKRICLENVLELNPNNLRAREALEQLGPAPQQSASSTQGEPRSSASGPLRTRPSSAGARSAQGQRRRLNPIIFIGGGIFAIALIVFGLVLAVNQGNPAPTPTVVPGAANAGGTAVSANVAASDTPVPSTPQGTVVTAEPKTVVADTATNTDTPFPTFTPSATLPSIGVYKLLFMGDGRAANVQTLYTIQGDGQNEAPYLAGKGPAFGPALSRTGKLAYIGMEGDKQQLFVADQTGQNAKVITKFTGEHLSSPSWSPDGSKIALAASAAGPKDDPATSEIYLVDTVASTTRQLTTNTFEDRDPSWSPDGQRIVYASDATSSKSLQLTFYDLNLDKTVPMTQASGNNYSPAWSPDGKQLAYVSTRDSFPNVYVVSLDDPLTTHLVSINGGNSTNRDPAWSPDGKYIAFASDRGGTVFNLYITTPDGKYMTALTSLTAAPSGTAPSGTAPGPTATGPTTTSTTTPTRTTTPSRTATSRTTPGGTATSGTATSSTPTSIPATITPTSTGTPAPMNNSYEPVFFPGATS